MDEHAGNFLEDLCLLLPVRTGRCLGRVQPPAAGRAGGSWMWSVLLRVAAPRRHPADLNTSASVQLEGPWGAITLRLTPETAAWDADYGIRLDEDCTYPEEHGE